VSEAAGGFFALTPDRVLDAVEVGGLRCTGRCMALRAFENRVYEVELEDERSVVVKFYRPGRWSRETILDEHQFLADLVEAELDAVAPLDLGTGATLNEKDGIFYAAFPKIRARTLQEGDDESLRRVGRLIGRMHAVGAGRPAPHRRGFTVENFVLEPLDTIIKGGFIKEPFASRYRDVALKIADVARKPLERIRPQRIHGDLHWGNLLWGRDGPILLDFDDCVMGPPVQDIWLLARGDAEESKHARLQILEGYELFREFDRESLALIEPLRAMRIVHMSGWLARRWDDPSFKSGFPAFGGDQYWASEYEALYRVFESL